MNCYECNDRGWIEEFNSDGTEMIHCECNDEEIPSQQCDMCASWETADDLDKDGTCDTCVTIMREEDYHQRRKERGL